MIIFKLPTLLFFLCAPSKIFKHRSRPQERFLPQLTECQSDPLKLGDAFVASKEQLQLYVVYCKNKTESEGVYREFAGYFEVRVGEPILEPSLEERHILTDFFFKMTLGNSPLLSISELILIIP